MIPQNLFLLTLSPLGLSPSQLRLRTLHLEGSLRPLGDRPSTMASGRCPEPFRQGIGLLKGQWSSSCPVCQQCSRACRDGSSAQVGARRWEANLASLVGAISNPGLTPSGVFSCMSNYMVYGRRVSSRQKRGRCSITIGTTIGAGHRREQNPVVVLAAEQYERPCHLEKSDGPAIRRQTQRLQRTIAQR